MKKVCTSTRVIFVLRDRGCDLDGLVKGWMLLMKKSKCASLRRGLFRIVLGGFWWGCVFVVGKKKKRN